MPPAESAHSSLLAKSWSSTEKTKKTHPKWRTSLLLLVALAATVLFINTGFLVWAIATKPTQDGTGTLYQAPCAEARKVNIGIHLLINILSSLLLGGSNYCMQCLSAPSRVEVDAAHAQGGYLDIGVPSLHNITSSVFSFKKKACWWTLALSSFPLHLCYNSAVFATLHPERYQICLVGSDIKAAMDNGTLINSHPYVEYDYVRPFAMNYAAASSQDRMERLDVQDCIREYSQPLQFSRGVLVLVAPSKAVEPDYLFCIQAQIELFSEGCAADLGTNWVYGQYPWPGQKMPPNCIPKDHNVLLPKLLSNATTDGSWTPLGPNSDVPVEHCLSEKLHQTCRLKFSIHLGVVVIAFNALKLCAMICCVAMLRNNPLLTIGDASSSFLQESDESTKLMCLASQKAVHSSILKGVRVTSMPFRRSRPRWFSSVKRGKLITCVAAVLTGISVLLGLFIWRYIAMPGAKSLRSVLALGLGTVDPRTVIINDRMPKKGTAAILTFALIANSPQVIISLIYFSYNATITSMLLAREWSSYFTRAKGLRISGSTTGAQRNAYFLQLPLRYGVPLLAFSCLLHYLSSQSIFLVTLDDGGFVTCAYSPIGIFMCMLVSFVLLVFLVILGVQRLSPMPVVGSCSVAIAASCHARPWEDAPWEKRVRWGAFEDGEERDGDIGHCGLSSEDVCEPVENYVYA